MTTHHPAYRLESVPLPPDTLSEGARKEWKELAPVVYEMQTARIADLRAFQLLTEILADISKLEETIRADGILIKTGTNSYKTHPAQKSLEAARRQAQRLLDQFGLVPGSKARRVDKFHLGSHKRRYG